NSHIIDIELMIHSILQKYKESICEIDEIDEEYDFFFIRSIKMGIWPDGAIRVDIMIHELIAYNIICKYDIIEISAIFDIITDYYVKSPIKKVKITELNHNG